MKQNLLSKNRKILSVKFITMKKIFIIATILATISMLSQEVENPKHTKKIDEIKLESQRYLKSKRYSSQEIETITQKEIEFGNYQSTAEMLSGSGNIFVQKSQQGGGSPVLRGLEANRILLLIDGIRMNNLIFRGGHLQNVIAVDENMLENVDILFGSSSTPYGSDAMGGAINLITKKPFLLSKTNTKKNSGNINTRYGTVNKEKSIYGDFRLSGTKWASLTAFSFNYFGDLKMGAKKNGENDFFGIRNNYVETINNVDVLMVNDNPLVQKFSEYKQYNAMQKILYKPNETSSHNVNLQYSTTSAIPRYDRLTDKTSSGLKSAVWEYGPQKRVLAAYNYNKSRAFLNSDLNIGANYQNLEESRITRRFGNPNLETRLEKVAIYGINAELKAKIGKGELLYGIEGFYDNLKSTANNKDIITGNTTPLDTRYPDGKNYTLHTDAFVSYFSKINDNSTYNVGARAGYATLHSDIVNNSFFNLPYTEVNQKNITYSAAVGITNNSTENVKIALNIASGFRTPNVDDLSKIFESAGDILIVPNQNLRPEKNITGDLNITLYDQENFQFENTVYYTRLFDAIVTDNFTFNNQSTIIYNGVVSNIQANQNFGKASIFGYNALMKAKLSAHFKWYGSFNYTYGRVETTTEKPLDHIPPFYGKTGITFENKFLNADIYMLYNGKKHLEDYSTSGEDNLKYAPANGMPAWQTYNIKTAVNILKELQFYTGIENILDIQYRNFASGINAPGRNYYFGATYHF